MKTFTVLGLLLCCVQSAAAQAVVGTVTEQGTNAPIRGAFVMLLNAQGQQVAGALADARGAFMFRVQPGTYSVRADQIGHRSARSGPLTVQAQRTETVRLVLEVNAVRLREIDVRGENRCVGRPEGSQATAQVWEEARKALTVWAWVEKSEYGTFNTRSYILELDPTLRPAGPAEYKFGNTRGRAAYRAEDPDTLARYGYMRQKGGDTFIYGVDAHVLLSSSFLSQHCFKLVRDKARAGLIGLAFEPVRGRRLPDVKGTLWLDEATARLAFVEYGYTGVSNWDDPLHAGGRTEFEQLENGAWIVRRWYVRSPRLAARANAPPSLIGVREEGSEIVAARVTGSNEQEMIERASISGFVLDSLTGRPLEGARVYLSGSTHTTRSGLAGAFRLDSVPSGLYAISFIHPAADSLPRYPQPQLIDLRAPGLSGVKLGTPSAASVTASVCSAEQLQRNRELTRDRDKENVGILFGDLSVPALERDAYEITVRWDRFAVNSRSLEGVRRGGFALDTGPDESGRFVICGVPVNHPIVLELRKGKELVLRESLRLLPPGIRRWDYSVKQ